MDEHGSQKLSSEEAGAIVAQWYERNPVGLDDLVRRLEIDPTQVESIRRQARGRMSMEAWLLGQKSTSDHRPTFNLKPYVAILVVVVLLGGPFIVLKSRIGSNLDIPRGSIQEPDQIRVLSNSGQQPRSSVEQVMGASPVVLHPEFEQSNVPPETVLGRDVGAQIADSMNFPTVPGHAPDSPVAGHAVPIRSSQGQLKSPHPGMGGMRAAPMSYLHNLTEELAKNGIIVPSDLRIVLSTPTATYLATGKMAKNVSSAKNLTVSGLSQVLQAFVIMVLKDDLLPTSPDSPSEASWAMIRMDLGQASARQPLHWVNSERNGLLKKFLNERDAISTSFIAPFLKDIQKAGSNLFSTVRVAAIPRA